MRIIKDYLWVLVLLLLVFITHLHWFSFQSTIFSWDFPLWHNELIKGFFPLGAGVWTGYQDFGNYNIQPYLNGFLSLWGLFDSYHWALRCTILLPLLVIQVGGTILLLKKLFSEKSVAFPIFVGSAYFIFHTYILYTSFSHLFILFSVSLLPLLLYVYLRLLDKQSFLNIIVFSLVFSLSCIYEMRITLINIFLLLCFSVYEHKKFVLLLKNYTAMSFLVIFIVLLNTFWLVSIWGGSFSQEAGKVINRGVFGNSLTNIFYAFLGYKPYWDLSGVSVDFQLKSIPFVVYLSYLILLSNFFFPKKHPLTLLSVILVALGTFLLKQDTPPFFGSYSFLYDTLPGFSLFREGSKFSLISIMGYMLGFTIFVYHISTLRNKQLRVLGYMLPVIIILYPALPLFLQKVTYTYSPRVFHKEFALLNQTIKEDPDAFKTLSLPNPSKLLFYSNKNPSINFLSPEIYGFLGIEEHTEQGAIRIVDTFFSHQDLQNFLNLGGIKYIVLNFEDTTNEDNSFQYFGNRIDFLNALENNLSFLEHKKIGKLDLFVNSEYFDPVFSTRNHIKGLEDQVDHLNNTHVSQKHDSQGYSFQIKGLQGSQYLHLSQKNNENWGLYLPNNSILSLRNASTLGTKITSLGFLNSWKISKDEVIDFVEKTHGEELRKQGYPKLLSQGRSDYKYYLLNDDGSIDVSLSMFFKQQATALLGWYISIGTLVMMLLGVGIYLMIQRFKHKHL